MNSKNFLFLSLLFLFSPISAQASHQWPALRNSVQGGASTSYQGNKSIEEWHFSNPSKRRYEPEITIWASPALAVVNNTPMAFIGGYDQSIHALDLASKTELWKKVTNGYINSAPVVGTVNSLDVVFFASTDRTVYAHIAINGRNLWTKELIPPSNTLETAHLSSPFIHETHLYIAAFAYDKSLARNKQKGMLFCLDITSGSIIWKMQIATGQLTSPVGYEIDQKRYIAVAQRRGLIQSFDVSGERPLKKWAFQMPHEVFGSPVIAKNSGNPLLFLGSKYGNIIAINAETGKEVWQHMAGNWIDNTAAVGIVDGKEVLFTGSHDYNLYAFDASDGSLLWQQATGGEIYSAPVFFNLNNKPVVAAASLDNHIYLMNARDGKIITAWFTGNPVFDKISKGENLWGSPAAFEAGDNSALIHGSFSDKVYVIPVVKESSLTAMTRSPESLWWGLFIVLIIFGGIILPVILHNWEKK